MGAEQAHNQDASRMRIGQGFDVHPFTVGRPCILGGVAIPHTAGLAGHSDADALLHAIIDALLGAAGKPDIGCLFPDTDATWKGASSVDLLRRAWASLSAEGYTLINIDSTVLAEAPRIAPHAAAMKERIAEALGATPSQIGIKASTTERLGFVGRGEGIVATAVALLMAPEAGRS